MFNPKIIFWLGLGLVVSMLSPDTLVKILAVLWVLFMGHYGFVRGLFWWATRKGAVTVDFGCEHRAHSILCDTLSVAPGTCTCVPTHPTNCGHCGHGT